MNLCIKSFTCICIISCVISLPLTLGFESSQDNTTNTIASTTEPVTSVSDKNLNNQTTIPTTASAITTEKTTTTPSTTTASADPTEPDTSTTVAPNTTSTNTPKTTVPPITTSTTPPPPQPCRRFDGPSFIGGSVLSMGLVAISFICYKFYKARNERNYHTL
ncbi:sialomucin core protein 24 [Condylostylus longicornis]|uniref:sialomucin core protein 24 n=1 Tax=Condylostylus longicornis TaxID=2530218 RepID=UPI00244DABEA|nr:sialomucin core protein 24 [Condylostylus longicornis]